MRRFIVGASILGMLLLPDSRASAGYCVTVSPLISDTSVLGGQQVDGGDGQPSQHPMGTLGQHPDDSYFAADTYIESSFSLPQLSQVLSASGTFSIEYLADLSQNPDLVLGFTAHFEVSINGTDVAEATFQAGAEGIVPLSFSGTVDSNNPIFPGNDGTYTVRITSVEDFPTGASWKWVAGGSVMLSDGSDCGCMSVPEPASLTLLGVGGVGMLGYRLRRKGVAAAA